MSLEELLKGNGITMKEVKENIGKFVFLKDEDLLSIFKNKEIKDEYKTFVVETCFDRINHLPNNIFIKVVQYLENENLIEHYIDKIEILTKEEIFELINTDYIIPQFVIEITKTNNFGKLLEEEKLEKTDTRCLNLIHERDLFLDESIDNLRKQGKEILETFKINKNEYIINVYLDYIIYSIKNISNDDDIIKYSLEMLKEQIKNHKLLSENMLEFYALYRVKELNLEEYIDNVYVTHQDVTNSIAYYTKKEKCIRIFYERFIKMYKQEQEYGIPEGDLTDIINQNLIQVIAHELKHVIDEKRINQLIKNSNENAPFLKQELYRLFLRIMNDDHIYRNNHDCFLSENRADMFSYIDFAIQTNKIFRDTFKGEILEKISSYNALGIIEMYTEITDKGRKVVSPVRKFYDFFQQQTKNKYPQKKIKNDSSNLLANLLEGDNIPLEIIVEINKIATGERKTTNLYQEILRIIDEYQTKLTQEKELPKVI